MLSNMSKSTEPPLQGPRVISPADNSILPRPDSRRHPVRQLFSRSGRSLTSGSLSDEEDEYPGLDEIPRLPPLEGSGATLMPSQDKRDHRTHSDEVVDKKDGETGGDEVRKVGRLCSVVSLVSLSCGNRLAETLLALRGLSRLTMG